MKAIMQMSMTFSGLFLHKFTLNGEVCTYAKASKQTRMHARPGIIWRHNKYSPPLFSRNTIVTNYSNQCKYKQSELQLWERQAPYCMRGPSRALFGIYEERWRVWNDRGLFLLEALWKDVRLVNKYIHKPNMQVINTQCFSLRICTFYCQYNSL